MSAPSGYSMASTSPAQRAPSSSQGMSASQSSRNSANWSFEDVTSYTDSTYHSTRHVPSQHSSEIPRSEPRRIPTADDEGSPCRHCGVSDGEMLSQIPGILANKNNAKVYGIEPAQMKRKLDRLERKQLHFEHRQWLCKNEHCGYTWYTYSYWFGRVDGEMIMRYTRKEDEFFNQLRSWAQNLNPFRFIDKSPSKGRPPWKARIEQAPAIRTPQYVQCSDLQLRDSRRSSYNDLEDSQITIVPRSNEAADNQLGNALLDQFLSETTNTLDHDPSLPSTLLDNNISHPWTGPIYDNPSESTDSVQLPEQSLHYPDEGMRQQAPRVSHPAVPYLTNIYHQFLPQQQQQQQHHSPAANHPTVSISAAQYPANAFSQSVPNLDSTGRVAMNPMLISRLANQQAWEHPQKRKLDYDLFRKNRELGACDACRAKRRKCPPEHPKQRADSSRLSHTNDANTDDED